MTPKSKIEKLRNWIIKNYGKETWDEFQKYSNEAKGYESLEEFAENYPIEDLINFAFYWTYTVNRNFWCNMDNAWQEHLNQEIEK